MKIYFGYQVEEIMKERDRLIESLQRQIDKLEKQMEEKDKSLRIAVDNLLMSAGSRTVTPPKPTEKTELKADLDIFAMVNSIGGDTNDPDDAKLAQQEPKHG